MSNKVNFDVKSADLTSDAYDYYTKVIEKEVRKYLARKFPNYGKSEYLVQSLIMETWECLYNVFLREKFWDFNHIKRYVVQTCVDFYRREMKGKRTSYTDEKGNPIYYEIDNNDFYDITDDKFDLDSVTTELGVPELVTQNNLEIERLMSFFDKNSKEYKFLAFILEWIDYKDFGIHPVDTGYKNGYTDGNLARYLGYKDEKVRSYRLFKEKMRKIVGDYFGKK